MGLDAFSSDNSTSSSSSSADKDTGVSWLDDFSGTEWNNMSTEEAVEHIRDNYIEDYYPSFQPDQDWDWEKVVEISCVCGEKFTFTKDGMCLNCGRKYKNVGRTVRKIADPHKDE